MSSSQPVCLQPRRVLQQFHLGAGLRQATVHGWQQQRRCNSTRHTNVGISYRNSQSSGSIGAVKTTDCEWMGQSNLQGACENSSHSSSSSSLLTGNCRSSRNNAASPLQGSSRSGQQGMPAPPSSNSNTQHSKQGRRVLVLHSTLMPTLLLLGSDDATTIVNSILSGYGLPTLKPSQGFKPYDEFDDDYVFECEWC